MWCWNVLDHTYDWRKILDNVVKYLKPDGQFILATDHKVPHLGHPSFKREEFFEEINKRFDIKKQVEDFSERQVCLILEIKK